MSRVVIIEMWRGGPSAFVWLSWHLAWISEAALEQSDDRTKRTNPRYWNVRGGVLRRSGLHKPALLPSSETAQRDVEESEGG